MSWIGETWNRVVGRATALDVAMLRRLVWLGFALRFALYLCSEGSNDIRKWARFGEAIHENGLAAGYLFDPKFNHPPLMGLFGMLAWRVSQALDVPFAVVFKVLPLLADVAGAFALLHVVRAGRSEREAWRATTTFALSLPSILVTSHHGNTDSVCGLFTFLSVALVAQRRRPLLAGLVMALALNVKLIPLVLVAPLALQWRRPRDFVLFSLGVGAAILPFVPLIVGAGGAFYSNAIAYNSLPDRWGIHWFFSMFSGAALLGPVLMKADLAYAAIARYLIIAGCIALGFWMRVTRSSALELGSLGLAVFLVLTPGIGVQYLCLPVLLFAATDVRRAWFYNVFAGILLAVTYLHFMRASLPLATAHKVPMPLAAAVFGLVAWLGLVDWLVSRVRRGVCAVSP